MTGVVSPETHLEQIQQAAPKVHLEVHQITICSSDELDSAFAATIGTPRQARDVLFNTQCGQLASLSVRHAMPAIYVAREFAAAGGLHFVRKCILSKYLSIHGDWESIKMKAIRQFSLPRLTQA